MEDVLVSMEQPPTFEVEPRSDPITQDRQDLSDLLFPANIREEPVVNDIADERPDIEIPRETYNFSNYAHSDVSSSRKCRKKEKKRLRKFSNFLIKHSLRRKIRNLYGDEKTDFTEELLRTYDKLVKKSELDHVELTRLQMLLHQEAYEKNSPDEFLINILSKNLKTIPCIKNIEEEDINQLIKTFKNTCMPNCINIIQATRTIYANENELETIITEGKDYTWDIAKMVGGLFVATIAVFFNSSKFFSGNIKQKKPLNEAYMFKPIPFKEPLPNIDDEL